MQKQVLVTKEYIVNYPKQTQSAVAKAKKRTLLPPDLVTKVVIVEGGTQCSLTASELAEILDMQVGNQTNRTRTAQLHWWDCCKQHKTTALVFCKYWTWGHNSTDTQLGHFCCELKSTFLLFLGWRRQSYKDFHVWNFVFEIHPTVTENKPD